MSIEQIPAAELAVEVDWTGISRRYLNPGELEVLCGLIESVSPKVVIEIGVNEGRTPQVLLARNPGIERYIGIDVPPGYKFGCAVQSKEVPAMPGHLAAGDERFELVLRKNGSFDLSQHDLPEACAVFIDGDHSWRAVLRDSLLARAVVRAGGIIIWHDYHDLGSVDVRDVLDALASAPGAQIKHVDGTWFCFERKAPALKPR